MVAFDLETSAPSPEDARIVTACVVHVGGGLPTETREWLVNPGVEIPEGATAVHGITTERARAEGVDPTVAVREITDALTDAWSAGLPVVAFNAAYDLTVLDREIARHHDTTFTVAGPVIDPYVIDREVDKYRKGSRTLTAQAEHYRVSLDGAHDATADAVCAARLVWRIGCMFPTVAGLSLPDLHAAQEKWHAARQADFAAYLKRVGKPADDVCGEWPMRSRTLAGAQ
jgi:DNA polymerase-3 subunit epsilon